MMLAGSDEAGHFLLSAGVGMPHPKWGDHGDIGIGREH